MNKTGLLKIVNPLLALAALWQLLTGALRGFLPRGLFGTVHEAGAMFLAAAALLHLYLNWNWVKANYFPGRGPGTEAR